MNPSAINNKLDFYQTMLVDPQTGEALSYNVARDVFTGSHSRDYKLRDGIPVVLPVLPGDTNSNSFDYADHYEKDAVCFDYFEEQVFPATRFEQQRLHEVILSFLPTDAEKILDIGCGNGWVAEACLPAGKTVVSADISITNPRKALEKYPSPRHYGLVADALHLPVKPDFFDVIIASEIMEHVISPDIFVENLYKAVKPGGRVIITTPYHEKLEYSLCIHCNKPTPRHAHLHSFHEKNVGGIMPKGSNFHMFSFMNSYLLKLNTHVILKYFPLSFWRKIDKLAEWFRPSALRFIMIIQKPV